MELQPADIQDWGFVPIRNIQYEFVFYKNYAN